MIEISMYQLSYRRPNQWEYRLKVGRDWTNWFQVDANEFAAVAALLNEKPVYYDPDKEHIFTAEEPTGGT